MKFDIGEWVVARTRKSLANEGLSCFYDPNIEGRVFRVKDSQIGFPNDLYECRNRHCEDRYFYPYELEKFEWGEDAHLDTEVKIELITMWIRSLLLKGEGVRVVSGGAIKRIINEYLKAQEWDGDILKSGGSYEEVKDFFQNNITRIESLIEGGLPF